MIEQLKNAEGYKWIIEHNMVGFEPFTQFQPWYLLPQNDCFWANDKWHNKSLLNLLVFARRQDNDEFACFNIVNDTITNIYIIHGWTDNGYDIVNSCLDIWDWLHSALNDIKELVEMQ